jgi:cytochrome c oxidase subunit IV
MSVEHAQSTRTYYVVFALLLACTYLTWQVAYFDLGAFNAVAALGIAAFKAAIVVIFFMHARTSSRLTWMALAAGVFWLLLLIVVTSADYLTRSPN